MSAFRLACGLLLAAVLALPDAHAQALEVSGAEGDVRLQEQPLAAGAVLREGSELRTGPDGYVSFRLPDGSALVLLPGSEARAAAVRAGSLLFVLRRGRLQTVPGKPPPGVSAGTPQRIEVQAAFGSLTSRGGEFRVNLGAGGTTAIEAVGGAIDVQPVAGSPLTLPAGTGVVLLSGRPPGLPRPLLPAPNLWGGLRLVPQVPFDLDFSPLPGARGYRVAVQSIREGHGQVFEELTGKAAARLTAIANGEYVARVRAVDHDGLQGREAVALLRVSVKGGPPRLSSPVEGSRIYGDRVTFFWRQKDDAEGYILEIARDPAFRAVVARTPQLADPRHVAEGIAPGDYFWRVAARLPDGQLGLFSDGRAFSVRTGAPALAAPRIELESLRFNWTATPGQRYELQMAADREFRLVVVERTVDKLPFSVPRPAPGTYYARVRPLDADGPGPYAAPVSFAVGALPPKPACLVEGPKGVCAVYAPAAAPR